LSTANNEPMPQKELEQRISDFLKTQNMCVLATCKDNMPRATPIEYHSKGITLYFVGEPGTKLQNIKANPNVSVGVFAPYTDWNSVCGAQITGKAKIIPKSNTAEFNEGLEAYDWQKTAKQLGITTFPETVTLIKVEAKKIEYIEMALKKQGFKPQQTLNIP
jgi:nitroimidazol reductase NimA-like FMN-containing flavoprotein (pyridoxamine 5'-phosphate oxidase superfamily)